jgi:hypothetical protein
MYHLARNTWQTASRNTAHEAMNTLNADLRLASGVMNGNYSLCQNGPRKILLESVSRPDMRVRFSPLLLLNKGEKPLNEASKVFAGLG